MDYMNEKEIRYFSPSRSGYHAVVYWILEHHPAPGMFLNISVRHRNHRLRHRRTEAWAWDLKLSGYTEDEAVAEVMSICNNTLDDTKQKKLFIHSIEDPIDWPDEVELINDRSEVATYCRGKSEEIIDIIHIRDPFNMLGSLLYRRKNLGYRPNYMLIDFVWKGLGREWIRETQYLESPILLSYNDWFLSEEYRTQLGELIGLDEECKQQYQRVRGGPGSGSSFDILEKDNKASEMKVMERYKTALDHPLMKKFVEDEENVYLAREIFGDSAFDIESVIEEVYKETR